MARPRREIFECPQCGADVAVGARACRECGSDASTGWRDREDVEYASVDLPEGYAESPEHEGGPLPARRPGAVTLAIAVLVVVGLVASAVWRWWR